MASDQPTSSKRCSKCGDVKPLDAFPPSRRGLFGRYSLCLECRRARDRDWLANLSPEQREARNARAREYMRQRVQADPQYRKRARDRYKAKARDKARERNRDPQWKAKRACHAKVQRAIQYGRLVPEPCRDCGATERIQAHHEDYSKPLDVIWLCYLCHDKMHNNSATAREARAHG